MIAARVKLLQRHARSLLLTALALAFAVTLESGWHPAAAQANADEVSIASALNMAGRQRMLTQRMLKSYALIGLGANSDVVNEQLMGAVNTFESQHRSLSAFSNNSELNALLEEVYRRWQPYRKALLAPPEHASLAKLFRQESELLSVCEQVVATIERLTDRALPRLVNLSGRQRMLTQQLAKLYMLKASGLKMQAISDRLPSAINEFSAALATLQAAPENSALIDGQLTGVAEQWMWLESSLSLDADTYYPLIVDDASEKILRMMETVTAAYTRLAEAATAQ